MRLGTPAAIVLVGLMLVPPFSMASGAAGTGARTPEPNDNMSEAARIQPGVTIRDDVNATSDPADWFKLPVEKGRVINASLYTVDWPDLDAVLAINDAGAWLQGISNSSFRYETVIILATWTCDYYIGVFVEPGGGGGSYDLTVTISTPTQAADGGSYRGQLTNDSNHPADFYRIALNAGDELSAELSESPLHPPDAVSLDLYVMDIWTSSGCYTYLDESWWSDPVEKVRCRAPHDGDYYLLVSAYFGAGRYRLNVSVTPGPPGQDDFPPRARTVYSRAFFEDSVDQAQDHYDWYMLNMSSLSEGRLTVKTTFTSGWRTGIFELFILDEDLRILNGTTNYVIGRLNTTDRIDCATDLKGGGVYYVMVMAKRGLSSSDPADLSDVGAAGNYSILIDLPRANDPPYVEHPILVLGTDEDSPLGGIMLDGAFNDPDIPYGDILRFTASGSEHISISLEGARVTLTPAPGWSGKEEVVFWARDSMGATCEMRVPVTVSNVNHPPFVASRPVDIVLFPGQAYPRFLDLRKVFSDPDLAEGDNVYFNVSHSALDLYIEPLGFLSSATISAPSGDYTIILRARDRAGAEAETYIDISVPHVPRPPMAMAPFVHMEMDEDSTGYSPQMTELFRDPDGEPLTIIFSNAGNLNISWAEGGTLRIISEPDWSGLEEVFLEAWDGEGLSANMTMTVKVRPVNDLPRILSSFPEDNRSIAEGEDIVLRITATDPETPGNLTYRWTIDGNAVPSSSKAGNALSLRKLPAGNHIISVTVTDPEGAEASRMWAIGVIGAPPGPAVNATTVGSAGGTVVMVGLASWLVALLAVSENGKYGLFKLVLVPLYTKIQREEVLDQFTRGRIYGMIESNPGVHYTLIKKKMGVGNGTLTYHLTTLEREGFVRSEWDGLYKRFYPSQMARSPTDVLELSRVQTELMGHIRTDPGITQKELSMRTGLSKRVISYHISRMTQARLIRVVRDGKRTKCFALEGAS
jgi:hypothetical protein